MHVIEHVGLGRYGDQIQVNGHKIAFRNIIDYLKNIVNKENITISNNQVIKKIDNFEALENQYIKIKELALKEKQLKRIQSWMVEKIEDTYININKDNQSCNFTNKWVKN